MAAAGMVEREASRIERPRTVDRRALLAAVQLDLAKSQRQVRKLNQEIEWMQRWLERNS